MHTRSILDLMRDCGSHIYCVFILNLMRPNRSYRSPSSSSQQANIFILRWKLIIPPPLYYNNNIRRRHRIKHTRTQTLLSWECRLHPNNNLYLRISMEGRDTQPTTHLCANRLSINYSPIILSCNRFDCYGAVVRLSHLGFLKRWKCWLVLYMEGDYTRVCFILPACISPSSRHRVIWPDGAPRLAARRTSNGKRSNIYISFYVLWLLLVYCGVRRTLLNEWRNYVRFSAQTHTHIFLYNFFLMCTIRSSYI